MHTDHETNIARNKDRLNELLTAPSLKYADWPPVETAKLRQLAGVYHFYEMRDGHVDSVYVGKGGFGKGEAWSLYSRLKQHFQPSQKYALLGKASRALGVSPEEAKAQFNSSNLQLQWLALGNRTNCNAINLASELLRLECFAIAVLRPRYTDT